MVSKPINDDVFETDDEGVERKPKVSPPAFLHDAVSKAIDKWDQITKGESPPAGYSPIPGGTKGGYRAGQPGSYTYWYPHDYSPHAGARNIAYPKEEDHPELAQQKVRAALDRVKQFVRHAHEHVWHAIQHTAAELPMAAEGLKLLAGGTRPESHHIHAMVSVGTAIGTAALVGSGAGAVAGAAVIGKKFMLHVALQALHRYLNHAYTGVAALDFVHEIAAAGDLFLSDQEVATLSKADNAEMRKLSDGVLDEMETVLGWPWTPDQIKQIEQRKDKSKTKMSKAGEGSRGGHVIGHTPSGKAIYTNKHSGGSFLKEHAGWSKEDHEAASDEHSHQAVISSSLVGHLRMRNESLDEAPATTLLAQVSYHKRMADAHTKAAEGNDVGAASMANMAATHHTAAFTVPQEGAMAAKSEVFEVSDLSKAESYLASISRQQSQHAAAGGKFAGAGEGSRGGHIIGHTSSGKAIYAAGFTAVGFHEAHAGWTKEDHNEASKTHSDLIGSGKTRLGAGYHMAMADAHTKAAMSILPEGKNPGRLAETYTRNHTAAGEAAASAAKHFRSATQRNAFKSDHQEITMQKALVHDPMDLVKGQIGPDEIRKARSLSDQAETEFTPTDDVSKADNTLDLIKGQRQLPVGAKVRLGSMVMPVLPPAELRPERSRPGLLPPARVIGRQHDNRERQGFTRAPDGTIMDPRSGLRSPRVRKSEEFIAADDSEDHLAKAKKSKGPKADYFRTVAHHDIPFTGTPGKGHQVGGYPVGKHVHGNKDGGFEARADPDKEKEEAKGWSDTMAHARERVQGKDAPKGKKPTKTAPPKGNDSGGPAPKGDVFEVKEDHGIGGVIADVARIANEARTGKKIHKGDTFLAVE